MYLAFAVDQELLMTVYNILLAGTLSGEKMQHSFWTSGDPHGMGLC